MQQLIQFLFSPIAFALGLLWPLFTQLLLTVGVVDSFGYALVVGALVAIPWGLMATLRGSWLWIK